MKGLQKKKAAIIQGISAPKNQNNGNKVYVPISSLQA